MYVVDIVLSLRFGILSVLFVDSWFSSNGFGVVYVFCIGSLVVLRAWFVGDLFSA